MDLDEDVSMSGTMAMTAMLSPASLNNGIGPNSQLGTPPSDDDDSASASTTMSSNMDDNSVPTTEDASLPAKRRYLVGVFVKSKPAAPQLPYASKQTGLVYDPRMRFHTEKELEEDEEIHPEDPRRIFSIFNELDNAGLVADENDERDGGMTPFKLVRISPRFADPDEICLVHSRDHYKWMETLEQQSDEWLVSKGKSLDSLYLHNLTLYCARLSAGGAIQACLHVAAGYVKNAMAVIRPPGHHAEHDRPGGFCFFNNVAIAAKVCQAELGEKCRKVLILDWDVHHGNGVQHAFENDPNVLYISLHVYKGGQFYPSSPDGDHLHVGIDDGVGKNINIPWATHGMGDGDYIYAFQQIVMPCAQEFDPDLVIISAGFDAAEGDMLGGCHVSPGGFAHMTSMLMTLAGGKVVACLEGGYNLRSIAKSALAVTRTLMGEAPERLTDTTPSNSGVDTVRMVVSTHSQYWKCLYPKDKTRQRLTQEMRGERLHDILRAKQAHEWGGKFQMAPLFIYREKLLKSFENEVLATDNWDTARPLLVIFHDPPETIGEQNAHTGSFDAHNIIVTDVAQQYIKWAVSQDFSVIDVNIPKHITVEDSEKETQGYTESDSLETRQVRTRELATYLWENYIEINNAPHIFLIGVGAAYANIVKLVSDQDTAQDKVDHIFNFVSDNGLVAASRPADDYFSSWYYSHSSVYVAKDHACWNPERVRRLRKKYGSLHQSEYNDLSEILLEEKTAVFKEMLEKTKAWRERNQKPRRKTAKMDSEPPSSLPSYNASPYAQGPNAALQYNHEIAVRSSPSASPNPNLAGGPLRSPVRMPPKGLFGVTSPQNQGKTSPDKVVGSRSPYTGSPSRRPGPY